MIIQAGTVIKDRYRILKELGEGGFGTVYQAQDLALNREIALKILKDISESDFKRFQRESKLLARLSHPNIVSVYSIDILDDSRPMIAMEYLAGQSLKARINQSVGGLDAQFCKSILSQICAGLASAHSQSIVHRDLSPANIILVNDGANVSQVKIIDFGLSKLANADPSGHTIPGVTRTLTKTGSLVGNPSYMSPESCRGEVVDYKSDIYSLGCVLYEMLCGNPPFSSNEAIGILYKQLNEYPFEPAFDWGNPGKEELFKNIALLCLQKEKERRPESVEEIQNLVEDNLDLSSQLKQAQKWQSSSTTKKNPLLNSKYAIIFALLLVGLLLCVVMSVRQSTKERESRKTSSFGADQTAEFKRLRQRLDQKQALFGTNSPATVGAMTDLAYYLFDHNRRVEAEKILIILAAMPSSSIEFDNQLDATRMLVSCYRRTGNNSLAEDWVKRALGSIKRRIGQDNDTYLEWLERLGTVYAVERKFRDAELSNLQAVETAGRVHGTESVHYIRAEVELGKSYTNEHDSRKAVQMFEPAEEGAEKLLKQNLANVAQFKSAEDCIEVIKTLAEQYIKDQDFDKADRLLRSNVELMQHYPGCSLWVASLMVDLGRSLFLQKRNQEAIAVCKKASDQAARSGIESRAEAIEYLGAIAACLRENSEYADAIRVYEKGLELSDKESGSLSLRSLNFQNEIATSYVRAGKISEALALYKSIIPHYKALNNALREAMSLQGLAVCYMSENKINEGEKCFTEAIEIVEKSDPGNLIWIGDSLISLGDLCKKRKQPREAAKYFQQAFEVGINARNELYVSRVALKLADFMEESGDYGKAAETLRKAYDCFADNNSDYHPGQELTKRLALDLQKLGKNDEAEKYRLQAKRWESASR